MALAEILIFQLGPVISKAILKLWLKDQEFLQDISLSGVDIINRNVKNLWDRRRLHRQFETIGERVSQSLLELFEVEGSALDEASQEAIALAVRDAVENTPFDTEFIVRKDLDADALASHLLSHNSNLAIGFAASEVYFFESVIRELSDYIIQIAGQLPSFSENAFAEVLRRETLILNAIYETLDEVRQIRLYSGRDNASFETQYRFNSSQI